MRYVLLALVTSLILVAAASAARLETSATVELVAPAVAGLASWDDQTAPTWALSGAPGEQVQLSLELRTSDGRQLIAGEEIPLSLDATGNVLTTLPAPVVDPHAPLPVITLVVCRQ